MSIFNVISADTIVALVLGILGGQKLRITLGGSKIAVKGRSPKVIGKRAKRTAPPASAPTPSPSSEDPTLPYFIDPAS